LHHYVFGFADQWARWGSLAPALANALLTGLIASPLIKRMVGVARQRQLPRLAPKSYQRSRASAAKPEGQLAPPQVVLWPDTWNNYYHPQTLAAAETVLTLAGFHVETPRGHICCGRPLYEFGLLGAARAYLAKVLDRMASQIDAGVPFIFLEPSCASVFKDELLELFPNDPRALRMSRQVWLLADWLAAKAPEWAAGRLKGANVLIHGHCHHKAVFGGPASEIALLRQAGATVEPIQAGCCGMAGPFGFEADKFEVSKAIANDGFLSTIERAGPLTLIVADGFSCREQIAQLSHRRAMHFAEIMAHNCGCGK
jgi:Fe-S oxidoreductase